MSERTPRDKAPKEEAGPGLYAVLGVPSTASADELRKAFRKLALRYHPDKNPGDAVAAKMMLEIASAYDLLKDEARRATYDGFLQTMSPAAALEAANRENFSQRHSEQQQRAHQERYGGGSRARTGGDDSSRRAPRDERRDSTDGRREKETREFAEWFTQWLPQAEARITAACAQGDFALRRAIDTDRYDLVRRCVLRPFREAQQHFADFDAMVFRVVREYIKAWFNGGWFANASQSFADTVAQNPRDVPNAIQRLRNELGEKVDLLPGKKSAGLWKKLEEMIVATQAAERGKKSNAEHAARERQREAFSKWYTPWMAGVLQKSPKRFQDADYAAIVRDRTELSLKIQYMFPSGVAYVDAYDNKMQELARTDLNQWLTQLSTYLARLGSEKAKKKETFRATFLGKIAFLKPRSDQAAFMERFGKL